MKLPTIEEEKKLAAQYLQRLSVVAQKEKWGDDYPAEMKRRSKKGVEARKKLYTGKVLRKGAKKDTI